MRSFYVLQSFIDDADYIFSGVVALEYNKQFEHDKVCVSYVKIMPGEIIGDHYDIYPAVTVALDGGVITRLEADGAKTDVEFPTGQAVYRPAETEEKMHKI